MATGSQALFYIPALFFALLMGINIGSFLNVVIWRLPRGGSLVTPAWSYCPKCEHRLGLLDLFPVLSFIALGARCRYCKEAISWRYPGIELLTGILFLILAWRFEVTWETPFYCVAAAIWISIFFIDLEHFIIPDGLNVLLILVGIGHNAVAMVTHEPEQTGQIFGIRLPESLVGLFVYASIVYGIGLLAYMYLVGYGAGRGIFRTGWTYLKENVTDWLYLFVYYVGVALPPVRRFVEPPEPLVGATQQEIEEDEEAGGMGSGDGKLAAGIGAILYPVNSILSLLLAVIIALLYGGGKYLRNLRKFGTRTPIPFGPAMVAGAYLALLFGPQIIGWYIGAFWTFPGSPFAGPSGVGH